MIKRVTKDYQLGKECIFRNILVGPCNKIIHQIWVSSYSDHIKISI